MFALQVGRRRGCPFRPERYPENIRTGVGKSTLGQWVGEHLGFLWIEIDRWPEGDGIDLADLRTEWGISGML